MTFIVVAEGRDPFSSDGTFTMDDEHLVLEDGGSQRTVPRSEFIAIVRGDVAEELMNGELIRTLNAVRIIVDE